MTDTNYKDLDLTTLDGRITINHIIARLTGAENEYTPSWGHPPQYCTDLNVAIQLEHEYFKLKLEQWQNNNKWEWLATYYNNVKAHGIGVWHENPATAICLAWLAVFET